MKILTDDRDWARDIYEARALAMLGKHGRVMQGNACVQAFENGLTVTYYPSRTPMKLTVDLSGTRVLSVEWNGGDAWRMEIETFNSGRWERRLWTAAYPRPWLKRWADIGDFHWVTASKRCLGIPQSPSNARCNDKLFNCCGA
jgi:hypothetical protein